MNAGIPQGDKDRAAWIALLNRELTQRQHQGKEVFLPAPHSVKPTGSVLGQDCSPSVSSICEDPVNALVISVEHPLERVTAEILSALGNIPKKG